jgi:5-(carboxyamino)imidazole ribonucleotide mutase
MPNGIPVATVALNGAQNAGILAARILAVSDKVLQNKIENYMEGLKNKVFESRKTL